MDVLPVVESGPMEKLASEWWESGSWWQFAITISAARRYSEHPNSTANGL